VKANNTECKQQCMATMANSKVTLHQAQLNSTNWC